MATFAKIRSLHVRPFQSSDLAFNTAGVLTYQNLTLARLGQEVAAYDVAASLIPRLSETVSGHPEKLKFDSVAIRAALMPHTLFAIQNEMLSAALQQAIAHREIAFLEKFKRKTEYVNAINKVYSGGDAGKLRRLERLQQYARGRSEAIQAAYTATPGYGETDVYADSKSVVEVSGQAVATTKLSPVQMRNSKQTVTVSGPGGQSSTHDASETQTTPFAVAGNDWSELKGGELSFTSQQTTTDSTLVKQTSTSKNPEFKHPWLENLMRDQRSQLDIQDEVLLHETYALKVPEMGTIIEREREILDLEVLKAQLRYMQTFIVAPFRGVVTAVYKDLGEAVQAGESVIRVENDRTLLVVGFVQYRGALKVGRDVRITANNVFESNDSHMIPAKIVSVRGHDADDDEWDLIFECNNQPGLPINYHFDRDTTKIEVL